MDYASSAPNSVGAPQAPATPPTNDLLANAIGNLERAHRSIGDLESRLFGDAQPIQDETKPSVPDAVAWKANAVNNGSSSIAERLAAILNRL